VERPTCERECHRELVRVCPVGRTDDRGQQATGQQAGAASGPPTTGAIPGAQAIAVSRIDDMNLYNAQGNEFGAVGRVVQGPDGKQCLIIGAGGFLGPGERKVAIPTERVAMSHPAPVILHGKASLTKFRTHREGGPDCSAIPVTCMLGRLVITLTLLRQPLPGKGPFPSYAVPWHAMKRTAAFGAAGQALSRCWRLSRAGHRSCCPPSARLPPCPVAVSTTPVTPTPMRSMGPDCDQ
jgi:hypothetical protein